MLRLKAGPVCIDVTGGTFSMAAANVTLNRELKLSYVSNDGKVAVYNDEIGAVFLRTRAKSSRKVK
jgi:hypothetical protein